MGRPAGDRHAGLVLASWFVMAIRLGPGVYELAAPKSQKPRGETTYTYPIVFVSAGT